jgi:hypothetical protein
LFQIRLMHSREWRLQRHVNNRKNIYGSCDTYLDTLVDETFKRSSRLQHGLNGEFHRMLTELQSTIAQKCCAADSEIYTINVHVPGHMGKVSAYIYYT